MIAYAYPNSFNTEADDSSYTCYTGTLADTYSDYTQSTTCVIYNYLEWQTTATKKPIEFTPTHKIVNPFELDIFKTISQKHSLVKNNKISNITFRRQL